METAKNIALEALRTFPGWFVEHAAEPLAVAVVGVPALFILVGILVQSAIKQQKRRARCQGAPKAWWL